MLARVFVCISSLILLLINCTDDGREYMRFAVIGDYGRGGDSEIAVAALIRSKDPDFIITAGDNNYPTGSADTIDDNIGRFFHDFIYPYRGSRGHGAEYNRFFPTLGNHDLMEDAGRPYFDYFTLPNNERYYDFIEGPVHFFALNSDPSEVDGTTIGSAQEQWLQKKIASSSSPWKVVYFHHAPYSSALVHGSSVWMQWDFGAMGISAVFSGHDHDYERIHVAPVEYFVVGDCDDYLYDFGTPVAGSQVRYTGIPGVMFVHSTDTRVEFRFYNVGGELVDEHVISK